MTALGKAIAKGYKATHDGVTKLYRKTTNVFGMSSDELIASGDDVVRRFLQRSQKFDDLVAKYGDDILQFKPQGLNPNEIPQSLYNDMLSKYSPLLSDAKKKEFLNGLIKSGSDIPVKNIVNQGEELVKIVPAGKDPGLSSFFMSKSEFAKLKTSGNLEQKLGLPISSHAPKYDVFKITATKQTTIYNSTVAETIQNGYRTTGGATQSLVPDVTNGWSTPELIESFIP